MILIVTIERTSYDCSSIFNAIIETVKSSHFIDCGGQYPFGHKNGIPECHCLNVKKEASYNNDKN